MSYTPKHEKIFCVTTNLLKPPQSFIQYWLGLGLSQLIVPMHMIWCPQPSLGTIYNTYFSLAHVQGHGWTSILFHKNKLEGWISVNGWKLPNKATRLCPFPNIVRLPPSFHSYLSLGSLKGLGRREHFPQNFELPKLWRGID